MTLLVLNNWAQGFKFIARVVSLQEVVSLQDMVSLQEETEQVSTLSTDSLNGIHSSFLMTGAWVYLPSQKCILKLYIFSLVE